MLKPAPVRADTSLMKAPLTTLLVVIIAVLIPASAGAAGAANDDIPSHCKSQNVTRFTAAGRAAHRQGRDFLRNRRGKFSRCYTRAYNTAWFYEHGLLFAMQASPGHGYRARALNRGLRRARELDAFRFRAEGLPEPAGVFADR